MELQSISTSLAMAPACYGAPSVFAQDSTVCQQCPAFETCSTACIENLQKLQESLDVSDILRRHMMARKGVSAEKADELTPKPQNFKFLPSHKPSTSKVERKAKPQREVYAVSGELAEVIDTLNVKPKALALKLAREGLIGTIKSELRQGRSPYASQSKPDFLTVTCDELLKGSVTKDSLKRAMMHRLSWQGATAISHAGIVVQCFEGLGIIQGDVSGYVVSPETGGDNV